MAAGTQPNTVLSREDEPNFPLDGKYFRLIDEDGHPVVQGIEGASNPVRVDGRIEVERPAAQPAGVPIDVPMVIGIPPLQLTPYGRFSWQLRIDGQEREDWRLAFSTRA